jgi:sugar phosphate isomerase/epimerase
MNEQSNRREFLQKSLVSAATVTAIGGAVGGVAPAAMAAEEQEGTKAVLRLSAQEGVIPGKSLAEKLDKMEQWGFQGLEVGGGGLSRRVKELKEALNGRPIKLSATCAGFEGWLISNRREIRDQAMKTMKDILTAAGELGSTGLIIVPAFNGQESFDHKSSRIMLTHFDRWDKRPAKPPECLLQELGDHAAKVGTRILLEPLNRDECYFLRTLADGASICKDLDNPGIAMMGDFWHMTWEETSDCGAFLSAGKYLHHVHIASRRERKTPSEDGAADNYVDGFRGLKMIGYQNFVSLECGTKGDKEKVLPACVKLLREQWEQAKP